MKDGLQDIDHIVTVRAVLVLGLNRVVSLSAGSSRAHTLLSSSWIEEAKVEDLEERRVREYQTCMAGHLVPHLFSYLKLIAGVRLPVLMMSKIFNFDIWRVEEILH